MTAIVRKSLILVETTRREMGAALGADLRKAAGGRGDREPVRRPGRAGSGAFDRDRRGAGRRPRRDGGRSAGPGTGGDRELARPRSSARRAISSTPPRSCTPGLGKPLRAAVVAGRRAGAVAKKMGGVGTAIDVPLGHKDAAYVRSHFDAMEVRVADAPRAGEIVVAIVVTDGGRPLLGSAC